MLRSTRRPAFCMVTASVMAILLFRRLPARRSAPPAASTGCPPTSARRGGTRCRTAPPARPVRQERRDVRAVIGRGDLDDVHPDERELDRDPAYRVEQLTGGQP